MKLAKNILAKICIGLLASFAVACILIGINRAAHMATTYLMCDMETEGHVESYYKLKDNSDVLYPIIAYGVNGKKYLLKSESEVGTYPYDKKVIALVRYNSTDPAIATMQIELYDSLKYMGIEFIAAVLCFVLIGIITGEPDRKIQK